MKNKTIYRVSIGQSHAVIQDVFYIYANNWNAANKKASALVDNEPEWDIVKMEEIGELRGTP